MTALVSVVIVSYRDAGLLPAAIDSVLAQDDPALELVVVDNERSGSVAEVVDRYRGRPLRMIPGGLSTTGAGRNTGVAAARGSLLAFLDADDLWPPAGLAAARAALASDPALDGVFGRVRRFVDAEASPIADPDRAAGSAEAPRAARMITAALLDRASFDRVGPFDEAARLGDQIDWVARAADAGLRFGRIDDVVLLRRSHSANTTRERRDEYGEYARVLKQIMDRRRGRA